MPEISRFYGIVVRMYFEEHPPPHFHAYYGGQEALIDFRRSPFMQAGCLPERWAW
jgi:hypothetical protein